MAIDTQMGGTTPAARGQWRRLWPLALVAIAFIAAVAGGALDYLNFEFLLRSRTWMNEGIRAHGAISIAVYAVLYVAICAFSIPGAVFLTVAGGYLFGGLIGGGVTIVAATIGATFLFLAARHSLGGIFVARAGSRLQALRAGFERDAWSYMLSLRLTPAVPFFLVNLAAALLGVEVFTFIWTTFVGIIPGTFALAFVGAGLDSIAAAQTKAFEACLVSGAADCRAHIQVRQLLTSELLLGLTGLGAIALVPVVARRWRRRSMEAGSRG